jgi:hypothetical protein
LGKVQRYGAGEEAEDVKPGDFILTHRRRLMPMLISMAQRRRFRGADRLFAHWSHCALVVNEAGDLIEAESLGVIQSPLAKYRAREYHLVRLGPALSAGARARAVAYARARVGSAFGYLVLVSLMLWLIFGWRVRLGRRHHDICSGLVAHALQEAGELEGVDPTFILPADLAKAYGARP